MTDSEKLEKVYAFVKAQEDLYYNPIEEGKYAPGSASSIQCVLQAGAFQKVRYFLEELMEE